MAAHDLLAELDKRVLVCEGAMGSMLSADGTVVRDTGEMNLIAPEKVAAVHKAYQDAGANVFQSNTLTCNEEMLARTGHESAGGAEVFQSNTFTANEEMLARKGLADKSEDIARAGVRLLREAVGPDAFVAGGAGPTGKLVEPYGELSLAFLELGVRIVGGCCGTTPEHIARIAEVVAAFNRRPTSDNRHPTNSK